MARPRNAFTLIELLVVVSIIVILVAVLIPSLSAARRLARTAHCASNLKGISMANSVYTVEWNGALIGGPRTSNSALLADPMAVDTGNAYKPGVSNSNVPAGIIQTVDWMTGVARVMGAQFDEGTDESSRVNRFHQLVGGVSPKTGANEPGFKPFRCIENTYTSTAYGAAANPHPMISYSLVMGFQYMNGPSSGNVNAQINITYVTLPESYRPNLNLIGNPSMKGFIADGARWWNGSGSFAPSTTLTLNTTSPGGMDGDYGPWSAYTRSYYYGGSGANDARPAAMRHGRDRKPGTRYQSMAMNMGFFDGHVETMDGLTASNPDLWWPTDTVIPKSEAVTMTEITTKYWPGGTDHRVK